MDKVFESHRNDWFAWKSWQGALVGSMGVICAMVILTLSFWVAANPSGTYSAEEALVPVEATTEAKVVEYYLPYPGILPDSPLYKLKAIRDKVRLLITYDEGTKAKLELEYADKRINAALALAEGNKRSLAITTATKAEKYLESSTNRVLKLIKLGRDEKSLLLTLEKAAAKHGEILVLMGTGTGDEQDQALAQSVLLNKLMSERIGQVVLEQTQ